MRGVGFEPTKLTQYMNLINDIFIDYLSVPPLT